MNADETSNRERRQPRPHLRWECRCGDPPVLLAMYDTTGRVQIKVGARVYTTSGRVHATCPRCGAQRVLDMREGSWGAGSVPSVRGPGPTAR